MLFHSTKTEPHKLSSAASKQQNVSQQQGWDVWVLFWWNQHCTKPPQKSPMRTGSPSILGAGQRDGPGNPLQILPLAGILTGDIIGHVLHMQISKYKISYMNFSASKVDTIWDKYKALQMSSPMSIATHFQHLKANNEAFMYICYASFLPCVPLLVKCFMHAQNKCVCVSYTMTTITSNPVIKQLWVLWSCTRHIVILQTGKRMYWVFAWQGHRTNWCRSWRNMTVFLQVIYFEQR